MGLVLGMLAAVLIVHWTMAFVGRTFPSFGNMVFRFGRLIGLLLVVLWWFSMIDPNKTSKSTGLILLLVALGFAFLNPKKRFRKPDTENGEPKKQPERR